MHVRQGCRKIVVATNIAETSLTIPGISIVIDSGMVKAKYVPLLYSQCFHQLWTNDDEYVEIKNCFSPSGLELKEIQSGAFSLSSAVRHIDFHMLGHI